MIPNVRKLREGLQMRREALAGLADCSLQHLTMVEGGRSVPGLPMARRIAAALGVTVDQAFPALAEQSK